MKAIDFFSKPYSKRKKINQALKPYRRLAVLLFAGIALSNDKAIAQQAYFEEENFPSPTSGISLVNGIASDSNNCIWLTTQSGLYRYDGYRFRHYSTLNTPAIKFERMGGVHAVWKKDKLEWCIRDAKWNFYRTDKLSQLCSLTPGEQSQIVFGRYTLEVWKDHQRRGPLDSLGIYEVHYNRKRELFYVLRNNGKIEKISVAALLKGGYSSPLGELPGSTPTEFGNKNSFKVFTTDSVLYVVTSKGLMRMIDSLGVFQPVLMEGDIRYDNSSPNYESALIFSPVGSASIVMWNNGNIYELNESRTGNSIQTKLLARGLSSDIPSFCSPVADRVFFE
jgi:hypothetical protein